MIRTGATNRERLPNINSAVVDQLGPNGAGAPGALTHGDGTGVGQRAGADGEVGPEAAVDGLETDSARVGKALGGGDGGVAARGGALHPEGLGRGHVARDGADAPGDELHGAGGSRPQIQG